MSKEMKRAMMHFVPLVDRIVKKNHSLFFDRDLFVVRNASKEFLKSLTLTNHFVVISPNEIFFTWKLIEDSDKSVFLIKTNIPKMIDNISRLNKCLPIGNN